MRRQSSSAKASGCRPNPNGNSRREPNDEIASGGTHACAISDAYRFEAACTAGGLLFELPSELTFTGYYHVESTLVPGEPRRTVFRRTTCVRDVYVDPTSAVEDLDAGAMDATSGEAGQICQSNLGEIPLGGSCTSTVTHCPSAWTEICYNAALGEVVDPIAQGCGGSYCGILSVGFRAGCATVTQGFGDLDGMGDDGTQACLESYLLTHRFDCVPRDGWIDVPLSGCLLP